jgi:hypothetical protein
MMQMRIKAKANKPTGGRFSREIMAQRHQIYLACKAAEARKLLRETRSMKRKKTQKIAKSQVFSLENQDEKDAAALEGGSEKDAAALEGGSASASSVVGQVRGKRKKIVKTRTAGTS